MALRSLLGLVVAATACGRVGFDPPGDLVPGDTTDGPGRDAQCPYGPPRNLVELNSASTEQGGALTPDGLELYFASDRPGGAGSFDLYVARRSARGMAFAPPVRLAEIATAATEDDAFIEPDGLTLWFDSANHIGFATRPDTASPWGATQMVPELASPGRDLAVSLSSDRLSIYFSSDRPGTLGDLDLYRADRPQISAPWSPPIHLVTASTSSFECCPEIAGDGTMAMFTAYSTGGIDIVVSSLDTNRDLGPPSPFTAIDTPKDEVDYFVTPDDSVMGFSSDRDGAPGAYDLYLAERICP